MSRQQNTSGKQSWYSICTGCSAKFFATIRQKCCPRCGDEAIRSVPMQRPWLGGSDSAVAPSGGTDDLSSRRVASSNQPEVSIDMAQGLNAEIANILATKCRVLTVDQLKQHFFALRKDPADCAYRAVRTLKNLNLVETWETSLASLELGEPLLTYNPGETMPDFANLAWQNRQRWNRVRPQRAICLSATDKARAHFAGSCRPPRPRELEHDVAVAGLFLKFHTTIDVDNWQHEDSLPNQPGKRPDAIVHREEESVLIDVLGRGYSRRKIEHIWHEHRQQHLELY